MAAVSIVSGLLPVIIDKLMLPVIQRAFGTGKKRKKLKRILENIQSVIVDAEERQATDTSVKRWLFHLKEAAYEAEDILEEFVFESQRKKRSPRRKLQLHGKVIFYPSLSIRIKNPFSLSWRMSGTIEKLNTIAEEIHKFDFKPYKEPHIPYARLPTHSYVQEENIIGREEDKEKIMSLLIHPYNNNNNNNKVRVIAIVAMGGMGKTTLCKWISEDNRAKGIFDPLMWVYVSDDFDITRILQQIVELATEESCELKNMELLKRKILQAIKGKRYMIVLDDVWNDKWELWETLKTLLDCGGEGSVVLATTRNREAAQLMTNPSGTIYDLEELSEEDGWELFRRKAFEGRAEGTESLIYIGKRIARLCGGVPLALKSLGSMISTKEEEKDWIALSVSEIWRTEGAQDNILPALRLSYSYLSPHAKQCFSFCALYPKGFRMQREILVQLWMANGYIPVDKTADLEASGKRIYDELVWRSFFQNVKQVHGQFTSHSNVRCVMHDLMHDLAQSIMGDECLNMQKTEQWKDIPATVRHLLMPSFPQSLQPHIPIPATARTLLISRDRRRSRYESHGKDASKCKSLRALTWSPADFPKQIVIKSQLMHLRWLDISHTKIKELPKAICSLYYLQTLKLSGCYKLKELPDELIILENLRHLYTDGCNMLLRMPKKMGSMKQLHTLTMYVASDEAGRGIEQLRGLNIGGKLELRGIGNVTNAKNAEYADILSKVGLDELELKWGRRGSSDVFEALKPHRELRRLVVEEYHGHQFPMWMNEPLQLQYLVDIGLFNCNCSELPPLWQLPLLKELQMQHMFEVKHIISKSACGNIDVQVTVFFPSLRNLYMFDMENLEDLWEAGGSEAQELPDRKLFPCLNVLYIYNCEKLKDMAAIPSVKHLTLKSHCSASSPFERDAFSQFKSLHSLHISYCDWVFSSPIGLLKNLQSLQSLQIAHCKTLTSLPEEFQSICSLRDVSLSSCPGLTAMFSPGLSQLEYLMLSDCNSIKSLQGLEILTNLLYLTIMDCHGLESLPEGMEALTKLQYLEILRCNRLKSLPEGLRGRLSSLHWLIVLGHEELVRPFQQDGEHWHLTKNIVKLDIKVFDVETSSFSFISPLI